MIDLYYWPTPNGHKITMFLEETGLPYTIHPVNIGTGDQFKPEFLAFSPNNRMPAMIDRAPADGGEPVKIFESGAILIYLAEKTGKFLPSDLRKRFDVIQWLMWQMGGLGPMLGQVHHFVKYNAGKAPYAEERFSKEARRLYGVMNRRLAEAPYLGGDYSIADMACWPWISRFEWQGIDLNEFPNVKRWYVDIAGRPAVQRGYHIPVKQPSIPMPA